MRFTKYDAIGFVLYGALTAVHGYRYGDWQLYAICAVAVAINVVGWLEGRAER